MLHAAVHWPKDGLVSNFVESVKYFRNKTAVSTDVYLIFDRYSDYSIKSETRQKRIGKFN